MNWLKQNCENIAGGVIMLGIFVVVGFTGTFENEHIDFAGYVTRVAITFAVMAAAAFIGAWNDVGGGKQK